MALWWIFDEVHLWCATTDWWMAQSHASLMRCDHCLTVLETIGVHCPGCSDAAATATVNMILGQFYSTKIACTMTAYLWY